MLFFFVVKRYAVREATKWRYAVHNAKIERYAVRNGGVTLLNVFIARHSGTSFCPNTLIGSCLARKNMVFLV